MSTVSDGDVVNWLTEMSVSGYLNLDADSRALATRALAMLEVPKPAPAPEPGPLPEGQLSPHFSLAELTFSSTAASQGIDNTPDDAALEELDLLANRTLEGIRSICGDNPVLVTSGFRNPTVNALVGGASQSAHMSGAAADFTIPAFGSPIDVCNALLPHLEELEIDQLIHENDSWVHVGRAPGGGVPRHQALTINGGTTVNGIV